MKRLAHTLRKLGPDMSPDEVFRASSEQLSGLSIDVGVPPVRIERDQGVADALQHVAEPLTGGVGTLSGRGFAHACSGVGLRRLLGLCPDRWGTRDVRASAIREINRHWFGPRYTTSTQWVVLARDRADTGLSEDEGCCNVGPDTASPHDRAATGSPTSVIPGHVARDFDLALDTRPATIRSKARIGISNVERESTARRLTRRVPRTRHPFIEMGT